MLRSLRQTTGSWVVKIFLGIIMLSFAVWGVGDILQGPSDSTVAVVGNSEITATHFSNSYQREYQRIASRFGGRLSAEDARTLGLIDATLQQVVGQALFQQAAADLGLTASDRVIAADIRANPTFRNAVGQFDPAIFQQALANNGFNEESYVIATRRDIARNQLLGAITANAKAPNILVDRLFGYRGEQRIAELLIVPESTAPQIAEPNEAALQDYYRSHETDFTAPELRAVTYFTLLPEDLVSEVAVSEEDLATEYDIRLDEFVTLERRDVEQLLYENQESAQTAYDRLSKGEDLAVVAADTKSLTAAETSLGLITRTGLPKEARESVFALAAGQSSQPLKTGFGWHVFHVSTIEPGSTKTLEDVREQLRNDITLQRAGDALFDIANNIEDEFAGGASIIEAANRLNITIHRLTAVDASGRDADGNEIKGLPDIRNFLPAVFSAQVGDEPAMRENETGSYFAISVNEVIPPALRSFEKIRVKVHADWKKSARNDAVKAIADEIAEKVRLGGDIGGFAGTNGISFKITEPLTRDRLGTDYDVSAELMANLFAILPGEVTVSPTPARDGYVIAKLKEIKPADPTTGGDLRTALDRTVRQSMLGDIVAAYRSALTLEYGVEVNRGAIDAMF